MSFDPMLAYHILLWPLQILQVAILLLHDWIPLGRLNDLPAIRRDRSLLAAVLGTLLSSLFPVIGLAVCLAFAKSGWPAWLYKYLLAAYGFLFIGELEAWWIPYFLWPQPERAARYQVLYDNTGSFLPPRNGIRINTLHVVLHAATFATLLVLASHFFGHF